MKQQQLQKYRNCCMPQCQGQRYDIIHRFPRNGERLREWLAALQQPCLARMPHEQLQRSIFVCARHFRVSDYVHAESRSLNINAVPNVNLRDLGELAHCRATDSVSSRGSRILSELSTYLRREAATAAGGTSTETSGARLQGTAAAVTTADADADETANITLSVDEQQAHKATTIMAAATTTTTAATAAGIDDYDDDDEESFTAEHFVHEEEEEGDDKEEPPPRRVPVAATTAALPPPPKRGRFLAPFVKLESPSTADVKPKLLNNEPSKLRRLSAAASPPIELVVVEDGVPTSSRGGSTAPTAGYQLALAGRWLELRPQHEDDDGSGEVLSAPPLKLDVLWLRYQCRCGECASQTAASTLLQMPTSLRPDYATVQLPTSSDGDGDGDGEEGGAGAQLEIQWNDGHKSAYAMSMLHVLGGHAAPPASALRLLWSAQHIKYRDDFKAMPAAELLCRTASVQTALDRLQRAGVLIIEAIEASTPAEQATMAELLLRRLLPHLPAALERERRHVAPSQDRVPHTNCTYTSCDAALQVLSLCDADAAAAQLTLVDGYQAAAQLKRAQRQAYDMLCNTAQPLIYRSAAGLCHSRRTPIIRLSTKSDDGSGGGAVERITFSPQHIDTLRQREFQQLLLPLRKYAAALTDVQQQWQLTLRRRMIVVLDNWRICWQPKQAHNLDCIYVSRKDYNAHLAQHLQLDR